MAPMSLKTASMVKPIILKGSNRSQTSGKRKTNNSASGQQSAKRINQSKKAINVFIVRARHQKYSQTSDGR